MLLFEYRSEVRLLKVVATVAIVALADRDSAEAPKRQGRQS